MKKEITKTTVAGVAKEVKALLEGNRAVSIATRINGRGGDFVFTPTSFTVSGNLTAVKRRDVECLVSQIKRGFEVIVTVY